MGETVVDAEEIAGLTQGQQMEHAATMVPSVKRDNVLTCRNCNNKIHFAGICGQCQRQRSTSLNHNNGSSQWDGNNYRGNQ